MKLNTLKPAEGSKKAAKRVGRGIGSGLGKTGGRGHKGQKSRSGGYHKVGFEGGQMPLQRRLPKIGFNSRTARYTAEVRLYQINELDAEEITLELLKEKRVVSPWIRKVKIILQGELNRAVTVKGLAVTRGARKAIEDQGGKVE